MLWAEGRPLLLVPHTHRAVTGGLLAWAQCDWVKVVWRSVYVGKAPSFYGAAIFYRQWGYPLEFLVAWMAGMR